MGKFLIIIGIILVVAGLIIQFSGRIPYFGKLPGDIRVNRGNFSFYFPVATSILLSLIISLVLFLINRSRQ